MITTILFDMVGVLVIPNQKSTNSVEINKNIKNIEKLYNHIDDKHLLEDIEAKLHLSENEIQEAFKRMPFNYIENQEIWNLLPQLSRKYKLAIINNGNANALSYWKKHFDFSSFDLFLNSAEIGIKKPDSKIYKLACNKLDSKLDQCIYFDDDQTFLDTPNSLGITSVWWNKKFPPIKQLNKLLKNS